MLNLLNITTVLSALSVLFFNTNNASRSCKPSENSVSAGVEGCSSDYFNSTIIVKSNMEMPVDLYEQLQNKSLYRLLSRINPGVSETVVLLEPSTSLSLIATVPDVPEIKFKRVALPLSLSSDGASKQQQQEVHLPPRHPPVRRSDQVTLDLDVTTEDVAMRSDGSLRTPLINQQGPRNISSTHPQVRYLSGASSTCMAAKFRSLSVKPVYQFYDPKDGSPGVLSATLRLGQETTTNTYEGHEFYFTTELPASSARTNRDGGGHGGMAQPREIARFIMVPDQVTYLIINEEDEPAQIPGNLAHKYYETMAHNARELAFMAKYKAATGLEYKHYYGPNGPRDPPVLFMYPADRVGQVHRVQSPERHWLCEGPASECQTPSSEPRLELLLEVVSTAPRAFHIPNFLSDFEADHIIATCKGHVHQSGVGDGATGMHESDTRTSRNTWLKRDRDAITNSLYLRAADLLQIDENILHTQMNHKLAPGQRPSAVEDIQVVHYGVGQQYQTHHDWGVSGYPESRYLTLLLYLGDQPSPDAGGETSFPKSNSNSQFEVVPKKGTAVLFYDMLEDGNGDDLSAHAAMPVRKGEKWLANFWVWDPVKKA